MPIHISSHLGFALRNAIYTTDALVPVILIPLTLIALAWLGRRDILRAVRWSAALTLIITILDIIAVSALLRLQQEPYLRTLAGLFTMQGVYSIWGALDQLAVAGQLIVAALSLVASAGRSQWRWFSLLSACTMLACVAHGVLGDLSFLMRNAIPLGYLQESIAVSLLAGLLPLSAWIFARRQPVSALVP